MPVVCTIKTSPTFMWKYEVITETLVIPSPTEHTVNQRSMTKLWRQSKPATHIEDWPYRKRTIIAEVDGADLKVRVNNGRDEPTVWEVKKIFILSPTKIMVWWDSYEKEPSDRSLYPRSVPDFFVGVIEYREGLEILGRIAANPKKYHNCRPSLHAVSQEVFQRLMNMPGVKEKVANSIANPPPPLPHAHPHEFELPSLATISVPNMKVQFGDNGRYRRVEMVEIMCEDEPVIRVTWAY